MAAEDPGDIIMSFNIYEEFQLKVLSASASAAGAAIVAAVVFAVVVVVVVLVPSFLGAPSPV